MKYLSLFTCLGVCVSSPPLTSQGLPQPLARFQFDGNANDSTGNTGNTLFIKGSPKFNGNALYHDGEYGIKDKWNEPEVPICHTPSLDFNAFTIAIRFKAASFVENNILAGGRRSRWISFKIPYHHENPARNLTVTFNNQDFEYEYPVKLEAEKWYSLVCGVDLQSRTVTTYLNGDLLPSLKLPEDFKLRVLEGTDEYQTKEKRWCLANYSNGQTFHGLVDELAVFNGDVSSRVANDYYVNPLLVKVLRRRRIITDLGVVIDEIGKENNQLRQDFGRLERQLNAAGIQATNEGVIGYITRNNFDEEQDGIIANLIQQLGDDSFNKREVASTRLRSLGSRARKALRSAQTSNDPEIAWRSTKLLEYPVNQSKPTPPVFFALDYLRVKPSPKAVTCLLAAISKDAPSAQFARICAALVCCAQPENCDQIMKGLASENPRVRFAAIIATDRVFDSEAQTKVLGPYLSDEDELVRLAASSLLRDRSEASSEVLAKLQSSPSFTTRYLAKQLIDSQFTNRAAKPTPSISGITNANE